jgi:AraC family transcriptional regulator
MRRVSLIAAVLAALTIMTLPLSAQEKAAAGKAAGQEPGKAASAELAVIEIEPFSYAAVEMTGSYEQHADAFMKLYTAAGMQGLPMTGAPFGIYWNSPDDTAEEDLKWEIGMPVPGDKELEAPVVLKKWEWTTVIQRDFEGVIDGDEIKAAYYAMYEWIGANGYEMAGPMLERFLGMPSPNEKGETVGKVQIVFPVQKKK